MTVEQAIARSISHNEIVRLEWSHDAQTDLIVACDDWNDAGDVREFWGTSDDGSSWRVHLSLIDAESDPAPWHWDPGATEARRDR